MADAMAEWQERCHREHLASVGRGEHDDECEHDALGGFMLCHCSKRRREAKGFTEVPTDDLDFPPPDCPRCSEELIHDGDRWCCYGCSLTWASDGAGHTASFTDDYGDLGPCAEHGRRKEER